MTALAIAGGAATAILAVAGVLKMLGRAAALLTRIHDAVTVHLPARIDDNKVEIARTRDELRADHAEVRERLGELRTDLRDHIRQHEEST